MDIGLLVTFAGITVAGLAGVLGVWMERDREAPPRWAYVFSAFIVLAAGIEYAHSIAQASEDGETEEKMASVLERLTELAAKGDNPALQQFVGAELAAQSRSNPRVMKRLEKKVAAKGGDPTAVRRQASEGRRAAAGLPPRAKAKAGAGTAARTTGAAPAGAEGKAGKAGKVQGDEGKLGKAGPGAEGPAEGKTKVDPAQAGKVAGEAGKAAVEGKAGKAAGQAGKEAGKAAADEATKAVEDVVPSGIPGMGGKKK